MGRTYQLIVIGINDERRIIDISESEREFKGMKIVTLKKLLITRLPSLTGLAGIDDLRLLFSTQELGNEKTLSDYGIEHRSTIGTVCKLLGGGLEIEI